MKSDDQADSRKYKRKKDDNYWFTHYYVSNKNVSK